MVRRRMMTWEVVVTVDRTTNERSGGVVVAATTRTPLLAHRPLDLVLKSRPHFPAAAVAVALERRQRRAAATVE